MATTPKDVAPRPAHWPYRADPPGRYWGNYELYQKRGGMVRLEDDIRGFTAGEINDGDISRFYFFCVAFDQLMKEGIKGDVAELGTYKGHTATMLATMARRMGTTAWILDTFEGFKSEDLQGIDSDHRMEFDDTSLDAVRAFVGEDNVRFVQGHFPSSAAQMPDDLTFCLVHIDCDLYVPMTHALNYFFPRLVPGGYLIVHDYASLAWDGAERAVDEFFSGKAEPLIPLTDGCGSVVVRKRHEPGHAGNWLLRKRCSLFSESWTSAACGALLEILGEGWSGTEDWGVWGVGPTHVLNLSMIDWPNDDIVIELDAATALVGQYVERSIDVWAGGHLLTTWHFSLTENRAQRSVYVPVSAVVPGEWEVPLLRIEIRPHFYLPVSAMDPSQDDDRPLGLALFGIRRARGFTSKP